MFRTDKKDKKKEQRETLLQAEKLAIDGINEAQRTVVNGIKEIHEITTGAIQGERERT